MRGIINNIINFYDTETKILDVLITNTQKALEQSEKERKADEQSRRLENLVRDLNNMLTRFYFFNDRKNKRQEQMTDRQVKSITEFAIFVKTLTKKVCSLLNRLQQGQTFEEKIDEEIRELEASVRRRLKEFDAALDETSGTLTIRLINFTRDIASSFTKLIPVQRIYLTMTNSRKSYNPLGKSPQNTKEDSLARPQDSGDNELETLFNYSGIKSVKSDEKRSKRLMQLKA